MRSDPKLYPKMSVLKVGFYRELLSFGFNVRTSTRSHGTPLPSIPTPLSFAGPACVCDATRCRYRSGLATPTRFSSATLGP